MSERAITIARVEEIRASGTNPRKNFDETKLKELAGNIKTHGVLSPLLVRPLARGQMLSPALRAKEPDAEKYELVAGERRWRASKMAGLKDVPVICQEMSDAEAVEIQWIENLQRDDLTALEEADGYRTMIESGSYTADTLAAKLGKSRSHIFGRLKLARMHGEVREAVASGRLAQSIGEMIARIPGTPFQLEALKEILEGEPNQDYDRNRYEAAENIGEEDDEDEGEVKRPEGRAPREPFSFRKAKTLIQAKYLLNLKEATWDLKAEGIAGAVSCVKCPKRSGNCKEEWPEIKSADVCTNLTCFQLKRAAAVAPELEKWKGKGHVVFGPSEITEEYGRVKPPKGYVLATLDSNWNKGGYQKLEAVAKKAKVTTPVAIAVDGAGKAHRLYPAKEIYADLEAAGYEKAKGYNSREPELTPAQKAEKEAKAKAELELAEEISRRSAVEILAKIPGPEKKEFWWLLFNLKMGDRQNTVKALANAGIKANEYYERMETRAKALVKLKERPEVMRDILIEEELYETRWNPEVEQHVARVTEAGQWLAEELGIDLKAIEKEVRKSQGKKLEQEGTEGTERTERKAEEKKPKGKPEKKKGMSPEARARIAAMQRARWAKAKAKGAK
jgi:ParB/RepB/Spo0J family partition protein